MTWAKADDRYDDRPKIKRAWRLSGYAVGLHWMAVTASCRHENNGLVDPEWLAERLGVIPPKAAVTALTTLVDLGLFEVLPAGEARTFTDRKGFEVTVGPLEEDAHIVHDFLEYNDSSAFLADRRDKDSARKATGGKAGIRTDSGRNPNGTITDSGSPDPARPSPNGEDPPTPKGARVTFDRKPVPQDRLDLAHRLLADFNTQAGTGYAPYTGNGKTSENLKRIIGGLTRRPDVDEAWAQRAIRRQLKRPDPFWDGPPHTGVVFGEGTWDQVLEATKIAAVETQENRQAKFRALQGPLL